MNKLNRVLLFVHISTHFKEMWRMALLLKKTPGYVPVIFFDATYQDHNSDVELCKQHEIGYVLPEEFTTYNVAPISRKKAKKPKTIGQSKKLVNMYFIRMVASTLSPFEFAVKWFNKFSTRIILSERRPVKFSIKWFNIYSNRIMASGLRHLLFVASYISPLSEVFFRALKKYYPILWERYPKITPPTTRRAQFLYNTWPDFLEKYDISLVIFPEHNLFYFTQLVADIAKKKGIATIIVPFTIANSLEWLQSFQSLHSCQVNFGLNRVVAKKFPHWKIAYNDKTLVLPAEHVLVNEYLGTTPSVPWLINSGPIDAIFVESQAMMDYYLKAGISRNVLKITGALYDDELHAQISDSERIRKTLYEELKFADHSKPMLLLALPPDQLSSRLGSCEFTSYGDIVSYFFQTLSYYSDRYNIVVNLHPRVSEQDLPPMGRFKEIKISKQNIAQLIPLSSIYVASCSATIRMAIACGIPILNYDLYLYDYDDFKALKSVITMETKKDFEKYLNLLTQDPDYYQEMHVQQKKEAEAWACLDGKAGERMLKLIEGLVSHAN